MMCVLHNVSDSVVLQALVKGGKEGSSWERDYSSPSSLVLQVYVEDRRREGRVRGYGNWVFVAGLCGKVGGGGGRAGGADG